jgi:hypothetical protein
MYDSSIGIPFKAARACKNFEVPWSAVSILVRGVIDTAHHRFPWSAVSILVRGVIDTAHQRSAVSLTLLTMLVSDVH